MELPEFKSRSQLDIFLKYANYEEKEEGVSAQIFSGNLMKRKGGRFLKFVLFSAFGMACELLCLEVWNRFGCFSRSTQTL